MALVPGSRDRPPTPSSKCPRIAFNGPQVVSAQDEPDGLVKRPGSISVRWHFAVNSGVDAHYNTRKVSRKGKNPAPPKDKECRVQTVTVSIVVPLPTDFKPERPKPLPGEALQDYLRRRQAFRRAHRQPIKVERRKPRRRSPTTEPMRWLRDKVFAHVYGEKVGDNVYPSMTKEAFVGFYNQRRFGKRLPNYKLQDHFDRLKTYYYFSSPNKTAEHALVMIDVDVLKTKMLGSPEGAKKGSSGFRCRPRRKWPGSPPPVPGPARRCAAPPPPPGSGPGSAGSTGCPLTSARRPASRSLAPYY